MRLKDVTYEQSRAIFDKQAVLDGGGINYSGSMLKKKQIISGALAIWFFGIMAFAFSYGFSGIVDFAKSSEEGLKLLTLDQAQLVANLAKLILPVVTVLFVLMSLAFIVGLFLPLTLPKRIMYGQFCVYALMLPMILVSLIPISVGVAVAGAGWVGLLLQVFFSGWWLVASFRDNVMILFKELGDSVEHEDGTTLLFKVLSWLKHPILIGLVANVIVYCVTHEGPIYKRLLYLFVCWLPFLFSLLFGFLIYMTFKQIVSNWFFLKYAKQYKTDYEFSDIEWYGFRKARKIAWQRYDEARRANDKK